MNTKMSILRYLTKTNADGKQNTLTKAQARTMFKAKNIAARIYDLRKDGFVISTIDRQMSDGRTVKAYRLEDKSENVSKLFA